MKSRKFSRIQLMMLTPIMFACLTAHTQAATSTAATPAAAATGTINAAAKAKRTFRAPASPSASQDDQSCAKGFVTQRSGNAVNLTLNYGYSNQEYYNPNTDVMDNTKLRTYNGCASGPMIEVNPGDTLNVDLRNYLPASEPTFDCPVDDGTHAHGHNCNNTTNLHTHGLHVSPSGRSDNVLVDVAPGQRFQYEYKIPSNHPSGTMWYHPHRHGSTAIQVSSGGAGVLIVRGNRPVEQKAINGIADVDTILKDRQGKAFKEQIMMFQQVEYACFNSPTSLNPLQAPGTYESICSPSQVGEVRTYETQLKFTPDFRPGGNGNLASTWDISGRYTSINGVVQPALPGKGENIVAGEVQRWRMIHAGVRDSINVKIVKVNPAALGLGSVADGNLDDAWGRASLKMKAAGKAKSTATLAEICSGEVVNQEEFALDGNTRKNFIDKVQNTIHPGQRSDVLVSFPTAGLYCVLDEAADASNGVMQRPDGGRSKAHDRHLLAFARVVGAGSNGIVAKPEGEKSKYWAHVRNELVAANNKLPAKTKQDLASMSIVEYAAPGGDLVCPAEGCFKREDAFTIGPDLATGQLKFAVNGQMFNANRIDFQPVLGRTDDWSIYGQFAHVFHVHVNPFQIIDVVKQERGAGPAPGLPGPVISEESIFDKSTGKCKPKFAALDPTAPPGEDASQYCDMLNSVRDTVFQKSAYKIVMRTKYTDFTGQFVMHCHILDHEDEGMMQNIKVVTPAMAALSEVTTPMKNSLNRIEMAVKASPMVRAIRGLPQDLPEEICTVPTVVATTPSKAVVGSLDIKSVQ